MIKTDSLAAVWSFGFQLFDLLTEEEYFEEEERRITAFDKLTAVHDVMFTSVKHFWLFYSEELPALALELQR